MGKLIRRNVFETNSSNTHSLTLCSKNNYDRWANGEIFFSPWYDTFVEDKDDYYKKQYIRHEASIDWKEKTVEYNGVKLSYENWDYDTALNQFLTEENLNGISEEELNDYIAYVHGTETALFTMDDYFDYYCEYYDTYEEDYTTEGGEKLVAFGYYGHD